MAHHQLPLVSLANADDAMAKARRARRHLPMHIERGLALLPTVTVLGVLGIQALVTQRVLFASLASSAFLIYIDPGHRMNRVRTLLISQLSAAAFGWLTFSVLGPGYNVIDRRSEVGS